jgi:hypothetical protein
MDTIFVPPKSRGLAFHMFALLVLFLGSTVSVFQANRVEVGSSFTFSLIGLLVFSLPIPMVVYRAYGLLRAAYHLSPEGIVLDWGLRREIIPMENILWVSPAPYLERPLPLPRLRWPGGVVGIRRIRTGSVEYMATQSDKLIFIAAPGKIYAISPENPDAFLQTFQRQAEIGALNPISAHSIYPTFLLGSVWGSRLARTTIFIGLILSLIFLIWITFVFPASAFPLTNSNGSRTITQAQVLLLSIVNALFFLVDLFLGLFLFRRPESQLMAHLLWGSSVLTSLLLFIAIINFL